ncbi:hypothetical protein Gohar_018366 [Gossypium harknessii]|nr:hypothetical protein [Gossypium aridum]MBA0793997.1 hypothetical protein [Gossypium harknessii]MBA0824560.1 hypothetical protein [Gossypium armourianum]
MDTVKDVLGRWGRKVAEATRKAEDLAGNTWQHSGMNSIAIALLGLELISSAWSFWLVDITEN